MHAKQRTVLTNGPYFQLLILLCGVAAAQPQLSLATEAEAVNRRVFALGTWLDMDVRGPDALAVSEQILTTIQHVERQLTIWHPNSEVSRCNALPLNQSLALSPATAAALQRAEHWTTWSGGAFAPMEAERLHAATAPGSKEGWRWQGDTLTRQSATARLDTDAFAKGAALEAALNGLPESVQVRLNAGGQLALHGCAWSGPLSSPLDREQPGPSLSIPNGSLSTSGSSARSGHLRDPATGAAVRWRGQVTVWAPKALDADCASTACFVLGSDAALPLVNQTPDLECSFEIITPDGAILTMASDGWKRITANPETPNTP